MKRKSVGKSESYHGRTLTVEHMGPDLLAFVDGVELNGFYLTSEAALSAARRHVDHERKAKGEA